jgi:hypothetical protein
MYEYIISFGTFCDDEGRAGIDTYPEGIEIGS